MSHYPPAPVIDTVRRGLELRRRFDRGEVVTVSEQLAKGSSISDDEMRGLRSFLRRYKQHYDPDVRKHDGGPTSATITWMLRGGSAASAWIDETLNDETFSIDCSVAKVDDELGIVFGYAIICKNEGEEYFDSQGDHVTETAMLEATADFMAGDRVAKLMHLGEQCGQVVFGFPLTEEIGKALEIDLVKTGFVVGMKPEDREILSKFKSGELTGFSIGGRRITETVIED